MNDQVRYRVPKGTPAELVACISTEGAVGIETGRIYKVVGEQGRDREATAYALKNPDTGVWLPGWWSARLFTRIEEARVTAVIESTY